MLAGGKDDRRAIVACARISSICAAVQSSTICMSWLVLSRTLLSFKRLLDFLTGALAQARTKSAQSRRCLPCRKDRGGVPTVSQSETKNAIYNSQFQYTRWGALFPVVDKPKTETVLS